MSQRQNDLRISVAEYLEGEKDATIRHEYIDGDVYAMAGASDRHNLLAGILYSRLLNHPGRGPCQVFISDMKVRVAESIYYYPDVMMSCDPPGGDRYSRTQPVLIIEVSSPGTERIDHHEKLLAYLQIASLREYVLVNQDRPLIEVHRRSGDSWRTELLLQPDDVLRLESADLSLSLAEIYRNAALEPW